MAAAAELRRRPTATPSSIPDAIPSSPTVPLEKTQAALDAVFIAQHGRLRRRIDAPIFDAFRRETENVPLTALDYFKGVLAFVLIPLRMGLSVCFMVVPWLVIAAIGPPTNDDAQAPIVFLPPWRRKLCTYASRFLGRGLLIVMGFWNLNGRDDPGYDDKAANRATIISNHASLADPCLLAYLYGPSFVAKKAVAMIPWIGRVGSSQHAFYIDRMATGGPSTTTVISRRQKLIDERETTLPPVGIFPEGTTTSGNYMLRLKTGAFVAGTPVCPIIIRYPYKNFSPSYESIRTLPYLFRMLSQFYNKIEYLRLPVYYPSAEEKANPRLYAENVRALMIGRSDFLPGSKKFIPSDANYVDKLELHSLQRNKPLQPNIKLNPL